jgi:branched-chain amino acid transport system ATP-binding protein
LTGLQAGPPALQIENLTAGYGATAVLRDVSLTVPRGGVVALLGPNGAGKTTLLRAASRFINPMSGRILLDGKDVTREQAYAVARSGLCHLPEGRGIFPSLSVRENLILSSPRRKESESIAQAMQVFPKLRERMKHQAASLSGGEQQMLSLVRAFVSNPRLVAVDEVSLGLAPVIADRIFDILREIAATGTALIIVEQYAQRALALAETVYLLNRGRVAYTGPAAEVDSTEFFTRYIGIEGDTGGDIRADAASAAERD